MFRHWKHECPLLKGKVTASKVKFKSSSSVKPVALTVSAPTLVYVQTTCLLHDSTFTSFITEGFVYVDAINEVPVKILRDTGSSETFVLESLLPFSSVVY